MDKKLLIAMIALIAVCVAVSGCTTTNNTTNSKNYTGNGYTFTYPGDWSLSKTTGNNSGDEIVLVTKGTLNDNSTPSFQIQKSSTKGMTEQEILNAEVMVPENYQEISTGNITIDGKTVKTTTYKINDATGKILRELSITYVKNGYVYHITLTAPEGSFDSEKANFDMILNSLKFQ